MGEQLSKKTRERRAKESPIRAPETKIEYENRRRARIPRAAPSIQNNSLRAKHLSRHDSNARERI